MSLYPVYHSLKDTDRREINIDTEPWGDSRTSRVHSKQVSDERLYVLNMILSALTPVCTLYALMQVLSVNKVLLTRFD